MVAASAESVKFGMFTERSAKLNSTHVENVSKILIYIGMFMCMHL